MPCPRRISKNPVRPVRKVCGSAAALAAFLSTPASATTYLYDSDGISVFVGGFAQLDVISDSTRSVGELEGSQAIDKANTPNGANGRLQFTTRNTRFSVGVMKTEPNGIRSKGYLELDMLGYDPKPEENNSEAGFYQNQTVRMRHAYLKVESSSWSLLAGQTWSLFGWQSEYLMTTVSDTAGTGALFERLPQLTATDIIGLAPKTYLQIGLSIERPLQRDSDLPNINAGARVKFGGREAPYTSTFGEVKPEAASLAVSSRTGFFSYPQAASVSAQGHKMASAVAVDGMLPIVALTQGGPLGNTLMLTGEFTKGSGYGDEFPNWSGNIAAPNGKAAQPPTSAGQPMIDPGLVGYKLSDGSFTTVNLQTWNSTMQYQMPQTWHAWSTAGFGELWSDNAADLVAATNKTIYTRTQIAFVNAVHDFTSEIRVGLEYNWFRVRYADNSHAVNNRVQLSSFYRF